MNNLISGRLVLRIIFYLIISIPLLACDSEYIDVSNEVEYMGLIGNKYESLEKLKLHGVTTSRNYSEKVDVYIVSRAPGSSGPEVLFRRNLPVGTIVEVTKVLRCENCLPQRVDLIVTVPTEELIPDIPVRLVNMISENQQEGEFTFNPASFQKIP